MLTAEEVIAVTKRMFQTFSEELPTYDTLYGYKAGSLGVPSVPDDASDEIKSIAKRSVKNLTGLVVNTFAQNLHVEGFRSPSADADVEAWSYWQANKLDARQTEVYVSGGTYGHTYGLVGKTSLALRSPRQMTTLWSNPWTDEFPQYALEILPDAAANLMRGVLWDATHSYSLTLGSLQPTVGTVVAPTQRTSTFALAKNVAPMIDGEPVPHNAVYMSQPVCPVVRFIDNRDSEQLLIGEVEPLIAAQREINDLNFDTNVVSRWGAFPQRYVIGWTPPTEQAVAKAGVSRTLVFPDGETKVGSFDAASLDHYNNLLRAKMLDFALLAQVTPAAITGDMQNYAAEAAVMVDKPQTTKVLAKQVNYGESWELALRVAGGYSGAVIPDDAEVIWRDADSTPLSVIGDFISKLTAAGIPVGDLIEDIPGWTQQRVDAVRNAITRQAGQAAIQSLFARPTDTTV